MGFFMFGRYKVGEVDQHDKKWARSITMIKSGPGRSA